MLYIILYNLSFFPVFKFVWKYLNISVFSSVAGIFNNLLSIVTEESQKLYSILSTDFKKLGNFECSQVFCIFTTAFRGIKIK